MGTKYVSKYPDEKGVIDWTPAENRTWNTLITRQTEIVKTRSAPQFLEGLDRIGFSRDRVPQHDEINKRLADFTGWQVEIVPALIAERRSTGELPIREHDAVLLRHAAQVPERVVADLIAQAA